MATGTASDGFRGVVRHPISGFLGSGAEGGRRRLRRRLYRLRLHRLAPSAPTASSRRTTFSELKNVCVWVKSNGGQGAFYRSQHEMICVFKNGTSTHINTFQLGQNGRSAQMSGRMPVLTRSKRASG
jgi:hypothetical protein